MKRILSIFLVLVATLSLVACKKDEPTKERTFVADGQYTAYDVKQENADKGQITWVTVTIENDQVKSFYIDQLQSNVKDGVINWNEKTKKELKYNYRMHGMWDKSEEDYIAALKEQGKLEWFEQAELIEAAFLADINSVTANAETGKLEGVTGVTIADNAYIACAKQAVENAKAGVINAVVAGLYDGNLDLAIASGKVNKDGKIVEVKLDELQSKYDASKEDKFAWADQTKQEKKYNYRMHGTANQGAMFAAPEAEYVQWLKDNNKLEWFEQANLLAEAWLNGTNITVNDSNHFEGVTGVTIKNAEYVEVFAKLLKGWTK